MNLNEERDANGNKNSIKKILIELDLYIRMIEKNLREREERERAEEKRVKRVLAAALITAVVLSAGIGVYGIYSNAIINGIMPLQKNTQKSAPLKESGIDMQRILRGLNEAINLYREKNGEYPSAISQIGYDIGINWENNVYYEKRNKGFILRSTDENAANVSYNEKGIVMPFKNREE